MSEAWHLSPERVDEVNQAVQECIDRIGGGRQYGTVVVTYAEPDWPRLQAVVQAECQVCEASMVMSTNGAEGSLRYLATNLRLYECVKRGHK